MMVAAFLVAAHVALAQAGSSYPRITVEPGFANGVHESCSVNFMVMFDDLAYLRGDPVVGDGSFALYYTDKKLLFALKLGISHATSRGTIETLTPSSAYLINGFDTNSGELAAAQDSDTTGYRLFVFNAQAQTAISSAQLGAREPFTVGYTLNGGNTAQKFSLSLTTDLGSRWSSCVDALLKKPAADEAKMQSGQRGAIH